MRQLGNKLLVASFSIVAALVSAEQLVRWDIARGRPIETRACRRESKIFHHELIPNTTCRSKYEEWDHEFKVNSLGFRDSETPISKPDGVFRVLLIGDSFIEGESVPLEDTAAWLVESELTRELDREIEVINMGVMSYSPLIYERVLRMKGVQLNPDLVIVAIDMSDYQNDYSYSRDLDEKGEFRNLLFQQKMGSDHTVLPGVNTQIKYWLRTRSALYSLFADRTKQLIRRYKQIPEPTIFLADDPVSDPHFATRSEENAGNPLVWEQFGKSLLGIDALMSENQIPWVAVTYPYGHQVAGDEWAKGRLKNGFLSGEIYPAASADLLVEFGNENGFRVVNTVSLFRKAADEMSEMLYYPYDGHFTPLGQRVFTIALKEVIRDNVAHDRSE